MHNVLHVFVVNMELLLADILYYNFGPDPNNNESLWKSSIMDALYAAAFSITIH